MWSKFNNFIAAAASVLALNSPVKAGEQFESPTIVVSGTTLASVRRIQEGWMTAISGIEWIDLWSVLDQQRQSDQREREILWGGITLLFAGTGLIIFRYRRELILVLRGETNKWMHTQNDTIEIDIDMIMENAQSLEEKLREIETKRSNYPANSYQRIIYDLQAYALIAKEIRIMRLNSGTISMNLELLERLSKNIILHQIDVWLIQIQDPNEIAFFLDLIESIPTIDLPEVLSDLVHKIYNNLKYWKEIFSLKSNFWLPNENSIA